MILKNGEYGKAAVTGLEALLTAGAIGSGFSSIYIKWYTTYKLFIY